MDYDVETRRWWGTGAHRSPRTAVPATDALARSTLAVPFYRDIGAAEIGGVAEVVLAATDAGALPASQHPAVAVLGAAKPSTATTASA